MNNRTLLALITLLSGLFVFQAVNKGAHKSNAAVKVRASQQHTGALPKADLAIVEAPLTLVAAAGPAPATPAVASVVTPSVVPAVAAGHHGFFFIPPFYVPPGGSHSSPPVIPPPSSVIPPPTTVVPPPITTAPPPPP